MSWIRLRQVALVAHDLGAVTDELQGLLGLEIAHRDPAVATFGLENAVLPLGTQFVEVVSPTRPETAAGRQLERLGGDGGYMVIGHTDDHGALRERVTDLGVRVVIDDVDADGYHVYQLHPSDTGGSFLELDFQPGGDDPEGPWMPAGEGWQRAVSTDVVSAITGVELRDPDPERTAERWSAITGLAVTDGVLELDNATVRFAEGTGGLVAVECRGTIERTVVIGGVEFRVSTGV